MNTQNDSLYSKGATWGETQEAGSKEDVEIGVGNGGNWN